jgi:hypothetical protein
MLARIKACARFSTYRDSFVDKTQDIDITLAMVLK